jgi:hypothetical protein
MYRRSKSERKRASNAISKQRKSKRVKDRTSSISVNKTRGRTHIKHLNHDDTVFLNDDELSGNKEERKDDGGEEVKESFLDHQDSRRFWKFIV